MKHCCFYKLSGSLLFGIVIAVISWVIPVAAMAESAEEDSQMLAQCSGLLRERRFDDCINALNSRVSAHSSKELWDCLAKAYYYKGDLQQAEDAYRQAIAIDRGYWCFWEGLAKVFYDEGHLQESLKLHQQAYILKEKARNAEPVVQAKHKKNETKTQGPAMAVIPGPLAPQATPAPVPQTLLNSTRIAQRDESAPIRSITVPASNGGKWRVKSDLPIENSDETASHPRDSGF